MFASLTFTPPASQAVIQARKRILEGVYQAYSDTGKGYRALHVTLANVAKDFPPDLLHFLKYIHLQRAITDRLELETLLTAACYCRAAGKTLHKLWHNVRRDDIWRALRRFDEHVRRDGLEIRNRETSLYDVFMFRIVQSLPADHKGGIVSATEHAIEEYLTSRTERRQKSIENLGRDTLLPTAPFVLAHDGITFIDTVGALEREYQYMGNCIADHIENVMSNEIFLYHIVRDGAEATLALNSAGKLVDADGRHHQANAASEWAWRYFEASEGR